MGYDKWKLPFGEFTFLNRIVKTLTARASRIVISTAGDTNLDIPIDDKFTVVVRDQYRDRGPLEGIRCGLKVLESEFEFAFVTACDVPLFDHRVIDFLIHRIGHSDAVVPTHDQQIFGLTALYRTDIHSILENLVKTKRLRVSSLTESLDVAQISAENLRLIDPELNCLKNINCPHDYFELLTQHGLDWDPDLEKRLSRERQPPTD